MITQLLVTIVVMAVILSGWVLVQRMIARADSVGGSCDPLEGRWGCAGCILSGRCDREE